jgi:hypothetical protein
MRRLGLVVGLGMALGIAFAQTGGQITGEVKDQSGASIPDATIAAHSKSTTSITRSSTTSPGHRETRVAYGPGVSGQAVSAVGQ